MATFTTVRSAATVQSGKTFKLANCEFQLVLTQSGLIVGRLYSGNVAIPVSPNSKRTILSTSYDGRTIYFTSTLEDYQALAATCRKSNRLDCRIATHRLFAQLEAIAQPQPEVAPAEVPAAPQPEVEPTEESQPQAEPATVTTIDPNLVSLTIRQLKAIGKAHKLPGYSRMTKFQLQYALTKHLA